MVFLCVDERDHTQKRTKIRHVCPLLPNYCICLFVYPSFFRQLDK
jgi:hypothetical protein